MLYCRFWKAPGGAHVIIYYRSNLVFFARHSSNQVVVLRRRYFSRVAVFLIALLHNVNSCHDWSSFYPPKPHIGNGGEVSKYLQQLPDDVLQSPEIRFALDIWASLKTENYARFFYLLRKKATILQACLMHRYVGEVRLQVSLTDCYKLMHMWYYWSSVIALTW